MKEVYQNIYEGGSSAYHLSLRSALNSIGLGKKSYVKTERLLLDANENIIDRKTVKTRKELDLENQDTKSNK